jgi:hypothetical protein
MLNTEPAEGSQKVPGRFLGQGVVELCGLVALGALEERVAR